MWDYAHYRKKIKSSMSWLRIWLHLQVQDPKFDVVGKKWSDTFKERPKNNICFYKRVAELHEYVFETRSGSEPQATNS